MDSIAKKIAAQQLDDRRREEWRQKQKSRNSFKSGLTKVWSNFYSALHRHSLGAVKKRRGLLFAGRFLQFCDFLIDHEVVGAFEYLHLVRKRISGPTAEELKLQADVRQPFVDAAKKYFEDRNFDPMPSLDEHFVRIRQLSCAVNAFGFSHESAILDFMDYHNARIDRQDENVEEIVKLLIPSVHEPQISNQIIKQSRLNKFDNVRSAQPLKTDNQTTKREFIPFEACLVIKGDHEMQKVAAMLNERNQFSGQTDAIQEFLDEIRAEATSWGDCDRYRERMRTIERRAKRKKRHLN